MPSLIEVGDFLRVFVKGIASVGKSLKSCKSSEGVHLASSVCVLLTQFLVSMYIFANKPVYSWRCTSPYSLEIQKREGIVHRDS